MVVVVHPRREGDPDEQPFGAEDPPRGLAPWLLVRVAENAMARRAQLLDRWTDRLGGFEVELEPCLWGRDVVRPALAPEGRLSGLGEWPQRERLDAVEAVVREVAGRRLLQLDAEALVPEGMRRIGFSNDRAESGDERDLHAVSLGPMPQRCTPIAKEPAQPLSSMA